MTTIKSILLHLDASPRCATRIGVAAALAERHDATVGAAFTATSAALAAAMAMGEGSGALASAAMNVDEERKQRAKEIFDGARAGRRVAWIELDDPAPEIGFVRAALTRDLLVLGQYNRADAGSRIVPSDFVETVILGSGKPALVVPYAGEFPRVGRHALVAWKSTRESSRALSAALPLLKAAERVTLATWGDDSAAARQWLLSHGIDAQVQREAAASGGQLGGLILSRVADLGADLLVMGCYGHSRAREFVLGGVTRTVLDSMTLPVLMAH